MKFTELAWVFAAAVAIHNLEEAIWLPEWSQTAERWRHPVGRREFRFAVTILTIFAAGAAALANLQGKQSIGAYLLCGYALAMLLNVVAPHILATLVTRHYAPGTITAVVINLPVTILLLRAALVEAYIDTSSFIWAGPLVVLGIVALIPVLFWVGRTMCGTR